MAERSKTWWSASQLTTDYSHLPATEPVTTIRMETLWPDWHTKAACYDQGYDDYFGTDSEARPALTIRQVKDAQDTCNTCPVFELCLETALYNNEEYGIWAGTTGRTRRRIQKMVAEGETTYPRVIEDYLNGRKHPYERGTRTSRRKLPGASGLPDADPGALTA